MPIPRRIAALLVAVALALPAAAAAQTPTQSQSQSLPTPAPTPDSGSNRSPVPLGGKKGDPKPGKKSSLPDTGTDPRLLFLAGLALTLVGAGLRLRTADADAY